MSTTRDLLIELGTEELPPKALPVLSAAFHTELTKRLRDARFGFSASRAYASPRRLAVLVENLEAFIANIQKIKPAAAKGTYVKKCVVAACMTPGVQVNV